MPPTDWRRRFNSAFEEEEEGEEDYGAYGRDSDDGSLRQSLLQAAAVWEKQREREESTLRALLADQRRKTESGEAYARWALKWSGGGRMSRCSLTRALPCSPASRASSPAPPRQDAPHRADQDGGADQFAA